LQLARRFPKIPFVRKIAMRPRTVLVVDDEYLIRWAIAHTLSDAGYEVTAAEDGLKAIEAAKEQNYDFVITDLDMPELGGWELLDVLLKLQAPPRVIVTSARIDHDNARKVKERGGWAYIEKSSSLIEGIKETLKAACAG
jgi:two-component system, NtrC family, nitrogen regulation response regulator NtrX